MTEFGEKLRILRLRGKLRQKELAARTGLRASTISDLEAGKSSPRQRTRTLLARALGMTLDAFDEATVTITAHAPSTNGRDPRPRPGDAAALLERVASGAESPGSLREALSSVPAVIWTTNTGLQVTSCWRTTPAGAAAGGDATGEPVNRWFAEELGEHASAALPVDAHDWVLRGETVTFTSTRGGYRWTTHLLPSRGPDGSVDGVLGVSISEAARNDLDPIAASDTDALRELAPC